LNHTNRDRQRGRLSEDDERFILQATRDIVEALGAEHALTPASVAEANVSGSETSGALRTVRILGCPARDEADALG
jgi:hypothetical protein